MRTGRLLLGVLAGCCVAAAPAGATSLRVGVGRADITPITGVYKGGWSCTCARAVGQQERLYARAVVLEEGGRRVALVTEDLFALSDGMIRDAASLLGGLGFSEQNIIDSATHDHSSPSGYMNFSAYNSILPSNSNPDLSGVSDTAADPAMYDFMTRQLALAIRRAVRDLRPGAVGWAQTRLLGITENRSLGAHLADFGVTGGGPNGGSVTQDPGGYADTIDPTVSVLRVDQWRSASRRLPVGIYTTFANHGTVDHENFWYYSGDHQGAAERVVEAAIRASGHVPADQDVVGAFANSDAGDMTSGIRFVGPAAAEYVGRAEAGAMLRAWRAAGTWIAGHGYAAAHPALGVRWTRVCFCGQDTSGGPIDSVPWIGKAAGAGSEEGRTIFYYDGAANEGDKLPFDHGPQGDKVTVLNESGSVPSAVPFAAVRVGSGLLVTVPGEPTVGVGALIRDAVGAEAARAGVRQVVVVGYAGDYLSYFTTPQEYEQQAYEGGFTLFGEFASLFVRDTLAGLTGDLLAGRPAPAPYPFDPSGGVGLGSAAYGSGAAAGVASSQPQGAVRLGHAVFAWRGGANGIDRPVDRAFIAVQRRAGGRWPAVTDDLGMQIIWSSDSSGQYTVSWEVPLDALPGRYRFVVTAKRYRIVSRVFHLGAGRILVASVSDGSVVLGYPQPYLLNDWTWRPADAAGGSVTFLVDGRRVLTRTRSGTRFRIPAGRSVVVPAGGARDRYGNTNARALTIR